MVELASIELSTYCVSNAKHFPTEPLRYQNTFQIIYNDRFLLLFGET